MGLKMYEILAMVDCVTHCDGLDALERGVRDRLSEFCLVELEYFFYRIKQRRDELTEPYVPPIKIVSFFKISLN